MIGSVLANVAALLVMPFLLTGVIARAKSLWSGRRGAPMFQLLFDVVRLLRKESVYSTTTTLVFRTAPYVLLVTTIGAALIAPLLGGRPIVSFRLDFVWLAYAWALGRVALMLAALDTGSSFEGMGASREATFATLLEPALFLIVGAMSLRSGTQTLHEALVPHVDGGAGVVVWLAGLVALTVVLQVETGRMPVDDPSTHLELTMVHEVMTLDHSGPDLAVIQLASAMKLFVGCSLLATMLSPWSGAAAGAGWAVGAGVHVALCVAVAALVGTIESLVARLELRVVPQYILVALASGALALLASAWRVGGVE